MKFGINDADFKLLHDKVISPLLNLQAKVYIFGSRATGKHKAHSDVDILFTTHEQHPLPQGFIAEITEAIEESNFPYKVDIVNSNEVAKSYLTQINSEKIEILK